MAAVETPVIVVDVVLVVAVLVVVAVLAAGVVGVGTPVDGNYGTSSLVQI